MMIEHLNREIDLVQHDDGTWRADKYPDIGEQLTSRRDDYGTRAELLRDLHAKPSSFWQKR